MKDRIFISNQIRKKKSFLCVGLDPDINKMPAQFQHSATALSDYCKMVVDLTHDISIAYKLNVAFFESLGPRGWEQFEELSQYIPDECLIIADAKRADIGNTSAMYAKYYFDRANVDALTLHPYMGIDSLDPFAKYNNKWLIILALTSNAGAQDFEMLKEKTTGEFIYERVLQAFTNCAFSDQCMFVVGATHPEHFKLVRKNVPEHFLLVPGVGEQGGDLMQTMEYGANKEGGLIINVGRKIMYPSAHDDLENLIRKAALTYQEQMADFIDRQSYTIT